RGSWWCKVADRSRRRGVYLRLLASRVRSQLAYPTSFALDLLGQAIGSAVELVIILAVFAQVDSLGGFTREEVLLIYALAGISFGLADLVRSEEHTSELQSRENLVCRLLLEKKK